MADLKAVLKKGLVDMKKSPAKVLNMDGDAAVCCSSEEEEYPYGLRIDLNKDSLKKLGLSVSDFVAEEEVTITAKCEVISLRSTKGKMANEQNVELQIVSLSLNDKE